MDELRVPCDTDTGHSVIRIKSLNLISNPPRRADAAEKLPQRQHSTAFRASSLSACADGPPVSEWLLLATGFHRSFRLSFSAMKTVNLNLTGGTDKKTAAEAFDHAETELAKVAVLLAAKRRRMTAEVLARMINDSDGVLTPDEIQEVWKEAIHQEWATDNGDGTFSLTEAGRWIIVASQIR